MSIECAQGALGTQGTQGAQGTMRLRIYRFDYSGFHSPAWAADIESEIDGYTRQPYEFCKDWADILRRQEVPSVCKSEPRNICFSEESINRDTVDLLLRIESEDCRRIFERDHNIVIDETHGVAHAFVSHQKHIATLSKIFDRLHNKKNIVCPPGSFVVGCSCASCVEASPGQRQVALFEAAKNAAIGSADAVDAVDAVALAVASASATHAYATCHPIDAVCKIYPFGQGSSIARGFICDGTLYPPGFFKNKGGCEESSMTHSSWMSACIDSQQDSKPPKRARADVAEDARKEGFAPHTHVPSNSHSYASTQGGYSYSYFPRASLSEFTRA